jgi:hypothetical protein
LASPSIWPCRSGWFPQQASLQQLQFPEGKWGQHLDIARGVECVLCEMLPAQMFQKTRQICAFKGQHDKTRAIFSCKEHGLVFCYKLLQTFARGNGRVFGKITLILKSVCQEGHKMRVLWMRKRKTIAQRRSIHHQQNNGYWVSRSILDFVINVLFPFNDLRYITCKQKKTQQVVQITWSNEVGFVQSNTTNAPTASR